MGICGAGAGISFSIILNSNPRIAKKRQVVQKIVSTITGKISEKKAARCCQRECYIALREAARLSAELLPVRLRADYPMTCEQYSINRECITSLCELYPNASYRSVKIKKEKERQILVPLPAAPESLTRK